jgi:hypothetical protein
MTNPDITAELIIADRSGSMHDVREDAEGGIAAFIAGQAAVPGRCTLRLVQFDDRYDVVYPSTPITEVPRYHLSPRGGTALLDAIGRAITEFGEELAAMPEGDRPGHVEVVVQTDGKENASKDWTIDAVKALIEQQERDYGWRFHFLGAGPDAMNQATAMGFAAHSSVAYGINETRTTYLAASAAVTRSRTGGAAGFTEAERAAAAGQQ